MRGKDDWGASLENQLKCYVFLDTNSINSNSLTCLFGREDELSHLSKMARIVVPRTVLDEVLEHKRLYFEGNVRALEKNPLFRLIELDYSAFRKIDYDSLENRILKSCPIEYEIAEIQDPARAFRTIYNLALHNKAPFDKGTDKGFKDACVALAINDYLEAYPGADKVLVISNDSRLQDYFSNTSVNCVTDIQTAIEFISCNRKTSVAPADDGTYASKRCRQEGQTTASPEVIDSLINDLATSNSFATTHSIVDKYQEFDFTQAGNSAGKKILQSCVRNYQVRYILADEDVRCFILPVFKTYQHLLSNVDYSHFVNSAELPNERVDSEGNVQLSRSEKIAYGNFARDLVAHIQSRNYGSDISTDLIDIERSLTSLLPQQNIDEKSVSWQKIAEIFIKGGVSASSSPVSPEVLRSFLSLLHQSSPTKANAIMNALRFRLEDIDEDIPF